MPYVNKEDSNKNKRELKQRRRAEFFKGKVCKDCGTDTYLILHHVDASTKRSHDIWGWGLARRLAEIAKCDVLCESCHGKYKFKPIATHGSDTTYRNHSCRCWACTEAHRRANAKFKKQKEERDATPFLVFLPSSKWVRYYFELGEW